MTTTTLADFQIYISVPLTFDMNFQINKFHLNSKVYDLILIKTSVVSKNHTNIGYFLNI